MDSDLEPQSDLRRAGVDRRHRQRHRARDVGRGSALAGRRGIHRGVRFGPHPRGAQGLSRAAGGDPFGGVGLHRLVGGEPADHRDLQRAGRPQCAQCRRDPGADGGADHDHHRRGRAQSGPGRLSRGGGGAGSDPAPGRGPRCLPGGAQRPGRGGTARRRPRLRRDHGGPDGERALHQHPDQRVRLGARFDRDHRRRAR